MPNVYCDHAATSPPCRDVLVRYEELLSDAAYNPSSTHACGRHARDVVNEALFTLAEVFDARSDQIVVTSGGTEAINLALRGYRTPRRFTPYVVTTDGEHKAVRTTLEALAHDGQLTWDALPLGADGRPDIEALKVHWDPSHPPTMISAIHVSNETGAVTDVAALVAARDQLCPDAIIHLDAVQTLGKEPFSFRALGVDMASFSAHKWGAPMGLGFLLVKDRRCLDPLLTGASQQGGLRAGSENAPLLGATAYAARKALDGLEAMRTKAHTLKEVCLKRLDTTGCSYHLLSPDQAVPHIVTLATSLRGETLARVLSDRGFMVGYGAACSSQSTAPNAVLSAMGWPREIVQGAIRIAFGPENSEGDATALADAIATAVQEFAL